MKKKGLCIVMVIGLFLGLSMGLTACGRNNLVGTWEFEEQNERMEFFSDGTMIFHFFSRGEWRVDGSGTWSSDGNRLTIRESWDTTVFTFSISGNTLTLTHDRWPDEPETLIRIR